MDLAPDIGLRGIILGIQRVEILLKSVVGRHARVYGAADRFGWTILHDRASGDG
jgi:hypothetical protein